MAGKKIARLSDYDLKQNTISDYVEPGAGVIEAGPVFNGGASATQQAQSKTANNTSNTTGGTKKINDPYKLMQLIYGAKVDWDKAYASGDQKRKDEIAAGAQEYYKQLRDLGYKGVADELGKVNAKGAENVINKWSKLGKTATRPYFYSLGEAYGLTKKDMDELISWDNDTGEVTFAGEKIGRPDTVVDGVSYWSDTSVLDKAFKNYIDKTTVDTSQLMNRNSLGVINKVNELWGMQTDDHNDMNNLYKKEYESIKNTNPFTTDEAKAILAKYDLAGLQGRDNAVASGSASNGGNIDSYSAANAMRQQASLINQGQMAVLDAHQQKLDNARSILEGLGIYQKDSYASMQDTIGIQQTEAQRLFEDSESKEQRLFENSESKEQRLFENDQTAKNNDVARKKTIADVSGYTPDEWVVSNNHYMNDDGTIKDEYKNTDFSAVMAKAKASGNTAAYNAAAAARFYKIMGDYGKYGKYDDGNYIIPGQQQTEAGRQFDENNKTVLRSLETEIEGQKYAIDAEKEASIHSANAQKEASIHATDAEKEASIHSANAQKDASIHATNAEKEASIHSANAQKEASIHSANAQKEASIHSANAQKEASIHATNAQKEMLELEALYSGGGSTNFTDNEVKEVDKVVKMINEECKKSSVTKNNPEEIDIISAAVNGVYQFKGTPNSPEAKHWRWQIIPIIYNSGLTDVQAAKLYAQLGFTNAELEEVFTGKGWK